MSFKISLPHGWSELDNPDGPVTFYRDLSESSGALQISTAEYNGGSLPDPTTEDLKRMSEEFGEKHECGQLVESSCGGCDFGRMGTAAFTSTEHPRTQIWFLSNGRDFILVTHICTTDADPIEVSEAQEIVRTLTFGKRTGWKFWGNK